MLTIKERNMISFAVDHASTAVSLLNDTAKYAVRKAYSAVEDNGEMARELFAASPDCFKSALAHFFRRHGMNVIMDGKKDTLSQIGGVIERAKQAKVFERLASDEAIVQIVTDKTKRPPKEYDGTWAEQADAWLKDSLARLKKARPEVAGIVNQRMQTPAPWVAKLSSLNLTDEEVQDMIEYVLEVRMETKLRAIG